MQQSSNGCEIATDFYTVYAGSFVTFSLLTTLHRMSQESPKPSKPSAPDKSLDDMLPPVQAPSAGFLLQLFLIPMIIVTIIVLVFLGFHWLAQMSSDPSDLIAGLSTTNETGWQKAHALSDLLRDPTKDHLKDDTELALKLAAILDQQIDGAESEQSSNPQQIRMRVYLCRALGEFRVAEVLPVLIKASSTERYESELDVRDHAIQSLAICAKNLADKFGPDSLHKNDALLEGLLAAANERGSDADEASVQRKRDELRSAAAYALGVVGGEVALDKLENMLNDAYADVRFNAATGLARHGDERAIPILVSMLDPTNPFVTRDEEAESKRLEESEVRQRERLLHRRGLVMVNAMRACEQLHRRNPAADLSEAMVMLERIREADLPSTLQTKAAESLLILND